MEVEHASPVSRHDDADQTGDNDRGNWHRRLRIRKSSAFVTEKSATEEEKLVAEPLKNIPKEPPQTEDLPHQTVNSSSGKLMFTCSNCKDGTAFSPRGLLDHFTVFHGGKGDPPIFPCDMCTFVTPEFTVLQQHRIKHRQCRLTCEICDDSVLQTLSQLRKHCNTQHSLDGQFHCKKCKFSTKELKNFVYHSCPASTESTVDSTEKKLVSKHVNGELNKNHVVGADWGPQKEELLKHKAADCCQGWRRKTWRKERKKEVSSEHQSVSMPDSLPKPPETQWMPSEFLHFSAAGLLDENGVLLNPAKTLEETQQFLERTVNSGKKWAVPLKGDPELIPQSCTLGSLPSQPKTKQYSIPVPGLKNYVKNKLSDLMEKNNISVPPGCTTKVVGFKTVDGKNHLILKVIPSAKPDICPDTGEVSPGLNPTEFNGTESDSQVEIRGDQSCAELPSEKSCNATSSSGQSEKVSENQSVETDSTEDSPHLDNTGNDCNNYCNNDRSAVTEASSGPPQLTVSGTKEDFNVANQYITEQQMMLPDMFSDSNNTHQLNGVVADVATEVSSLREVDIQTLNTNIYNIEHTKKTLTDSQEKALVVLKENCPELTISHSDSSCPGDFAGSIFSDLGSLKDSQLLALISAEDQSPHVDSSNVDKKKSVEAQVTPSSLHHLNEHKMETKQSSASPCSPENQAIFEPNNSNPAFVYLHKPTTEPLFNSPSEDVGLLFQDSDDEYTNNMDSRDAPVPLDQSCTSETVEETNYLAVSLLGDSCHNPDLYQTLEELPVTTVSHLLDDPEVTSRGITHQSEALGSWCTQQAGLQSPKVIPVAAEDSTQSNVCLSPVNEPAMKRRREGEPLTKDSQQHIPKARKQMVQRSQENDPPASIPYWKPVRQTEERTLKLLPVYSSQPIKVPHRNQPVIVLNHPDTDIPEVANIMRVVNKHRGAVQKVVLSQGTLKALSELNCDTFRKSLGADCHSSHCRRVWPQGTVRERFVLKLKLRRLCGHKYKVTPSASKANGYQSTFRCWFCGRLFRNQEAWVGHGQRHLMEATRDWNKLFSCNGQHNSPIEPYFH